MKKTAASFLALGVCVFTFGLHSVQPTLRSFVSHSAPLDPDRSALAVLASAPALPTAELSAPQPAPGDSALNVSRTVAADDAPIDPEPEVAAPPVQAVSTAPALAPALVMLPTVTPTPQPVAIVAAKSVPLADAAPNRAPDGCVVASPPPALGLHPFYTKYCSALGIPIVASSGVPDMALQRAWAIVTQMLNGMAQAEEIRNSITGMSTRIGIIGATQVTTDMPEHRALYTLFPGVDWNTRARGVGATPEIPLLSIAEENLLCYAGDLWAGQNVLVHEFAHAIKGMGLDFVNPAFDVELQRAYQHALDAGLWPQTYVSSNIDEYWAEGVRLYFQIDAAGVPGDQPYPANSRAELQVYDPDLYRIAESIFGARDGISPCPNP